jgi:hypothetical protein
MKASPNPESDVNITFATGPHLVLSVRQFLPAGPAKNGKHRDRSLVDVTCDDGRRVFAVADIWSRNPEKASDPW